MSLSCSFSLQFVIKPINLKLLEHELQYANRSIYKFLGFHSGVDELSGLQRCDTALLGDWYPMV